MNGLMIAAMLFVQSESYDLVRYGTFLYWWYLLLGSVECSIWLFAFVTSLISGKKAQAFNFFLCFSLGVAATIFGIYGANALFRGNFNLAFAQFFIVLCLGLLTDYYFMAITYQKKSDSSKSQ